MVFDIVSVGFECFLKLFMIQILEKLSEKGQIYFSFATFAHLDECSVFGIHILNLIMKMENIETRFQGHKCSYNMPSWCTFEKSVSSKCYREHDIVPTRVVLCRNLKWIYRNHSNNIARQTETPGKSIFFVVRKEFLVTWKVTLYPTMTDIPGVPIKIQHFNKA